MCVYAFACTVVQSKKKIDSSTLSLSSLVSARIFSWVSQLQYSANAYLMPSVGSFQCLPVDWGYLLLFPNSWRRQLRKRKGENFQSATATQMRQGTPTESVGAQQAGEVRSRLLPISSWGSPENIHISELRHHFQAPEPKAGSLHFKFLPSFLYDSPAHRLCVGRCIEHSSSRAKVGFGLLANEADVCRLVAPKRNSYISYLWSQWVAGV